MVTDDPRVVTAEAITIQDAATRLGVTRQRISQLLKSGALDGPPQASGVRGLPNAPRVYVASVQERQTRRAPSRQGGRRPVTGSEATLKDDAHRLKLALDVARDQIARQRGQNERLASLLAQAVAALQDEQALARDSDRITEQYAAIATNHLAPDSVPDEP